jgi:hypothetical protein
VVVFELGKRLFNGVTAFLSSFFFSLAGVNFLPVYWVVNITQSMPALLMLGSLLSFVLSRTTNRSIYAAVSVFLFIISLLLHEMAVVLPFMLTLYVLLIDESKRPRSFLLSHGVHYCITALYLISRFSIIPTTDAELVRLNGKFALDSAQKLFLFWNLSFNVGKTIVLFFNKTGAFVLNRYNWVFQAIILGAVAGIILRMKIGNRPKEDIVRFSKQLVFCLLFSVLAMAVFVPLPIVMAYRLNLAAVGACFFFAVLTDQSGGSRRLFLLRRLDRQSVPRQVACSADMWLLTRFPGVFAFGSRIRSRAHSEKTAYCASGCK